jgi:MGT family glycosyltransferase
MSARFVFFVADAWGPLGCTIPVAKELQRRGASVDFIVFDFHGFINRSNELIPALDAVAVLRNEGLSVVEADVPRLELPGRVPTPKNFFLEYRAFRSLFRDYLMPYYEHWLRAMLPRLAALDADVMWVKDQVLVGAFAAELLGVPWAGFSVHTGFLESDDSLPWTLGMSPPDGELQRSSNRLLKWGMRRLRMTLDGVVNRTRSRLGLPALADALFRTPVSPSLYLLFVARELEPRRDAWPPQVRFVGPYSWDEPRGFERPAWLAQASRTRPLIYASIGALSSRMELDFFTTLMQALGEEPYDVVVSTGSYQDDYVASRLPRAPANFRIEQFVPSSLGARSASVVVHHGGAGTTLQTLLAGAPAVAVPLNHEHHDFAQRLVETGSGIRIDKARLTPLKLRHAVGRLLQAPSYRSSAQALQRALTAYDAVGTCADELLALAERRRRGLPQPLGKAS